MERLTRREPDGDALPKEMFNYDRALGCVTWCSMHQHGMCNRCPVSEAFNRLAEYEDTGMAPDEIERMKHTLAELEWEMERNYELELGDDL